MKAIIPKASLAAKKPYTFHLEIYYETWNGSGWQNSDQTEWKEYFCSSTQIQQKAELIAAEGFISERRVEYVVVWRAGVDRLHPQPTHYIATISNRPFSIEGKPAGALEARQVIFHDPASGVSYLKPVPLYTDCGRFYSLAKPPPKRPPRALLCRSEITIAKFYLHLVDRLSAVNVEINYSPRGEIEWSLPITVR